MWLERWSRFGLTSEQEDRYRSAHLPSDLAQTRALALVALVSLIAFLYGDFRVFGTSRPFPALAVWRLGLVVGTLLLVRHLRGVEDYRAYDLAQFAWAMGCAVILVGMAATRPQGYVANGAVAAVCAFVAPLAMPNRFDNQAIVMAALALGEAGILALVSHPPQQTALVVYMVLLASGAVALVQSWQLNLSRRRAFAANEESARALGVLHHLNSALQRAKEDWERTFDSVPDLIAVLDNEHRIARVNQAMARALHTTPEACIGRRCYECVHGTTEPPPFCPHARSIADGQEHIVEIHEPLLGADLLVSTTPLRDEQGRVTGSVHVARDISERKRVEQEREVTLRFLRLLNSTRTTRELVEAAVDFLVDVSGCEAVGIRLRSDGDYPYYEAKGFPPDFVEAESSLCAIADDGRLLRDESGQPELACMCGRVIRGCFDASKPFFTPAGSFWTNGLGQLLACNTEADQHSLIRNRCTEQGYESVALIPLRSGQERIGLIQWSDRRKDRFTPDVIALWERLADGLAVALARARAEDALRESDRRKDEFLAMLAHELRNPLAGILGAAQVLQAGDLPEDRARRAHEIVARQARHMARMVDDLLDVSRVTQGKVVLQRERVWLHTAVESAIEAAGPRIREAGHQLHVSVPDRGLAVNADPVRLAQVVGNLLNNAAKYTPDGGEIHLAVEPKNGEVAIRVRDNGIGISPELLPRIFELFVQASHPGSPPREGLGIGLTLVRSLVEMHGGRVEARSDGLGRGSEFIVWLPLAAPLAADGSQQAESQPDPPPCRVLVVDDNADAAEMLAMALELEGHRVAVAVSGEHALQEAPKLHPDVVLLDLGMPGMDGFAVARHLREQPELADSVLVAVTGYGQESDRQRTAQAGFDHHLVKPVALEEVTRILRQVGARASAAPLDGAC